MWVQSISFPVYPACSTYFKVRKRKSLGLSDKLELGPPTAIEFGTQGDILLLASCNHPGIYTGPGTEQALLVNF